MRKERYKKQAPWGAVPMTLMERGRFDEPEQPENLEKPEYPE